MFWNRKPKQPTKTYDHGKERPVIRASICTGEQTACFQEMATGKLREIMLLRSEQDKKDFITEYGIKEEEIQIIY